jgi:transmembrane E3 ubiquitin-protein ligase
MAYSLYVSAVTAIQIYSAYVLLKIMDAPNFVFSAKFSLLTLSLCNIEDFSQTMTHIQYIMGSGSGYLFFILPALTLIVLFIIFDMKMLFLVWKSHNLANMDNPQLLRKRLTSFYIQFYLGLFLYLTLTYFFAYDPWMILLRNLLLLPQIVHNVRLGQKPNFNPYYIFGFIGSRLLVPLYERACPENRFKLAPNPTLFLILLSIFVLEVILIALQNRLGSRFFVPKRFLPNYYDYRTKIRASEVNSKEDCAICLQGLVEFRGHSGSTSGEAGLRINEESLV